MKVASSHPPCTSQRRGLGGLGRGGTGSTGSAYISLVAGYPMFCRSFPGLNRMVRPGGILTSRPVRGLRPIPRLRGFT